MNVTHTNVLSQIRWTRWTLGPSRDDARSATSSKVQLWLHLPHHRPLGGPRNADLPVISFTVIDCNAARASNQDASRDIAPYVVTGALIHLKFEVGIPF